MSPEKPRKEPQSYHDVKNSGARISVLQGGTRSGKTYSILKVLVEFCYVNRNLGWKIEIVRKTGTALSDTAMADFFEILVNEGYYQESLHNKNNGTYRLFGNLIKFTGVDQAQKKRGSKRDILFCNEANELTWDEFFQLNIRGVKKAIIDYNPTIEEDHWIYTKIKVRPDADFYISTYKDNPYLTQGEINEIEMLKHTDPYYWSVFGLGETTRNPARIYTYHEVPDIPDGAKFIGYGLDWGFSKSPSTLVGVWSRSVWDEAKKVQFKDLIVDEIFYEVGMTNEDISERMKVLGISKFDPIWADLAEPKSIEELRRRGWRINGAKKPRDAMQWSIGYIKQHRLFITAPSINAKKDFRMYKYKQDRSGRVLNEPVKMYDHCPDALRYCLISTAYRGKYVMQ